MKDKKPDWLKKGNAISGKIKSSPISLSMDEELRTLKEYLPETDTELIEEFFYEKANLSEEEFKIKIREYAISLTNIKSGKMSKEFRIYLSKKIQKNTTKPEIKKRMEEKIKEESK